MFTFAGVLSTSSIDHYEWDVGVSQYKCALARFFLAALSGFTSRVL